MRKSEVIHLWVGHVCHKTDTDTCSVTEISRQLDVDKIAREFQAHTEALGIFMVRSSAIFIIFNNILIFDYLFLY